MKIRIDNITKPLEVSISGNEPWLQPIYESFEVPSGRTVPKLTAQLKVVRESEEIFNISGHIDFAPWVDCSRCGDMISWSVASSFRYRIIPEEISSVEDSSGEKSFVYPDEEVISYAEGQFDLAEFLNDQVQLSIPLQTIRRSEDGKDCMDCGRSLEDAAVHRESEGEARAQNPFDELRKLKF